MTAARLVAELGRRKYQPTETRYNVGRYVKWEILRRDRHMRRVMIAHWRAIQMSGVKV